MTRRDTKIDVARVLADGKFHSGEELGAMFGVSRAAIASHIKTLSKLGLDIYSVSGKGYKLAKNLELLDAKTITPHLDDPKLVELHTIIDSTNEYLLQLIRSKESIPSGHTVVAECQTAGRGRRGRQWQSPFGSHIYLSQYRTMEDGLAAAAGLSLAIGLAVKNACEHFVAEEIELKWPNDVLCQGRKLAGVLIEAEGQSDGTCHLIIGIGINVDMPADIADKIDQPWVDLNQLTERPLNRNKFLVVLLRELESLYSEFQQNRLNCLVETWNKSNAFSQKAVDLISSNSIKTGKCLGIDSSGALLLEDMITGEVQKIYGGEVSLRQSET